MDDRMRVSDAEREAVTARLRDHFAEGRLTDGELDERVSAALSAKTFGELRSLTADLPGPVPLPPRAAARPDWSGPPPASPAGAAVPAARPAGDGCLRRRLGAIRVLPGDPAVLAGGHPGADRLRPGVPAQALAAVGRPRPGPAGGGGDARAAPMSYRTRHGRHARTTSTGNPPADPLRARGRSHGTPVAVVRGPRRPARPRGARHVACGAAPGRRGRHGHGWPVVALGPGGDAPRSGRAGQRGLSQ